MGLEVFRREVTLKQIPATEIARLTQEIQSQVMESSQWINDFNFNSIHENDLEHLFALYDRAFFDSRCRQSLEDQELSFRVSSRMTRAGGKTTRYRPRSNGGRSHYEICVSSTLLLQSFQEEGREVVVTGLVCGNRFDALQRVFEHELIHLIEMLLWEKSSCSQARFQSMASRYFGHRDYRHDLVTPREQASSLYGIRAGCRVAFDFEGNQLVGLVNRVTRRATVLVEDRKGIRYSNGKKYSKYYVPVEKLTRID